MKTYILRTPKPVEPQNPPASVVVVSQFLRDGFSISLTPGFSRVLNALRAKKRFQPFLPGEVVPRNGQAVETASPELCSNTGLKPGANERLQGIEMSQRSYLHIEMR